MQLDEISKLDKKVFQGHFLIGVYDNKSESVDKNKTKIIFRVNTEEDMNKFFDEANAKLKQ